MDYIRNKDGSLPSETIQYLAAIYISFALFILFTIGSVVYWPWSNPSCEAADRAMVNIAEQHDVELNWGEEQ